MNNTERTRTDEELMQQDKTTRIIDPGLSVYVTLLAVQREIVVTHGTFKKYLTYLGIEPICFRSGSSERKDASHGR
jgi:hypothetical protein